MRIFTRAVPILWRYLLYQYLRVFFLSVSSFVLVLFVLRFKDIAHFAALSADGIKTGLFILYQFPHILPLALPISALIASFLLFQSLSQSQEITALRALGFSLSSLLIPLLFASLFLTLANFSICAELAPLCRRETKMVLYRKTGVNPLVLLQRQKLARIKNTYMNLDMKEHGESAKNFLCIAYNKHNKRLNLINIKQLFVKQDELLGKKTALISHIPSAFPETFDDTILENEETMSTSASLLSQTLKRKRPNTEPNALSLKQIKIRLQATTNTKKDRAASIELLRRYSLSLTVFSFTLLGSAFGIQIGRTSNRRPLLTMCGWALLMFICYFLAKSLKTHYLIASLTLCLVHPILWIASLYRLHSINRGI
ncbi:MAG: LptF/LptG family permease [Chlamydiales bacterium]|nr:LptF/LptG family permease [Chlamydiales bacterium]